MPRQGKVHAAPDATACAVSDNDQDGRSPCVTRRTSFRCINFDDIDEAKASAPRATSLTGLAGRPSVHAASDSSAPAATAELLEGLARPPSVGATSSSSARAATAEPLEGLTGPSRVGAAPASSAQAVTAEPLGDSIAGSTSESRPSGNTAPARACGEKRTEQMQALRNELASERGEWETSTDAAAALRSELAEARACGERRTEQMQAVQADFAGERKEWMIASTAAAVALREELAEARLSGEKQALEMHALVDELARERKYKASALSAASDKPQAELDEARLRGEKQAEQIRALETDLANERSERETSSTATGGDVKFEEELDAPEAIDEIFREGLAQTDGIPASSEAAYGAADKALKERVAYLEDLLSEERKTRERVQKQCTESLIARSAAMERLKNADAANKSLEAKLADMQQSLWNTAAQLILAEEKHGRQAFALDVLDLEVVVSLAPWGEEATRCVVHVSASLLHVKESLASKLGRPDIVSRGHFVRRRTTDRIQLVRLHDEVLVTEIVSHEERRPGELLTLMLAGVDSLACGSQIPRLSQDQLLNLQADLGAGYMRPDFQSQLLGLEKEYIAGTDAYWVAHRLQCLIVQQEVLPKYGFEGTPEGVALMNQSMRDFENDEEVQGNGQYLLELLRLDREEMEIDEEDE